MKKLLLILVLLLPTLLIAQQDSTKQTFKISGGDFKPGDCIPVLAGKYYGSTTASLLEIMKNPIVEIKGCWDSARVISFNIMFVANNCKAECSPIGDSIPQETLKMLAQPGAGSFLCIRDIKYLSKGKVVTTNKRIVISALTK